MMNAISIIITASNVTGNQHRKFETTYAGNNDDT